MLKPKKIPLRMCIGCQEMKTKKELIRVVKDAENNIFFDPTGKKNGRGAYICKNVNCFERARKGKRLERAFAHSIGNDVYEMLAEQLQQSSGHIDQNGI